MIRTLGGMRWMSTVPEALVARHAGIETTISCLTNMACGILDQPLSHNEVIETAERVKKHFPEACYGIISRFNQIIIS